MVRPWRAQMRIKAAWGVGIAWALCLLLPLAPAAAQESTSQGQPITLQLKWHHQFQFVGYYMAAEQGFYKAQGLDVTILPGGPEGRVAEDVESGRAHFGVLGSELILERIKQRPLVMLAAIYQHSAWVLITRRDSGIVQPAGLAEKVVMLNLLESAEFRAMFVRDGIADRLPEVRQKDHTTMDQLIAGEIAGMAGYMGNQPYKIREAGVDVHLIRPIDYGIDFYGDSLFTSQAYMEKHPDVVARFRKASLQGWHYAMEHEEEAIAVVLGICAGKKTEDQLRFEAKSLPGLILPDFVQIGHVNPARVNRIAETYVRLDLAPSDYSLDGFFYTEPLPPSRSWLFILLGIATGVVLVTAFFGVRNRQLRLAVARARALHESEERYRAVAEDTPVFICRFLPSGEITYVNEAYCRYFGTTREEAVGSSFFALLPPEDLEEVKSNCLAMTVESPNQTREHQSQQRDSEPRWLRWTKRALFNAEGEPIAYQAIGEDVTERKRTRQALSDEKEFAEAALNSQHDLFFLFDHVTGTGVRWNRAFLDMTGYEHVEVEAMTSLAAYFDADDLERLGRCIEGVIATGAGTLEMDVVHKDGRHIPCEFNLSLLRDADGARKYVISVGRDVTSRRQAERDRLHLEREVQHMQKLESLGVLAGGIAHDFNNILASIMGNTELVMMRLPSTHTVVPNLREIEAGAARAAELTQQMLAYSGRGHFRLSATNLSTLVHDTAHLLQGTVAKNITLDLALDTDLPQVDADPAQLQQIVTNLLTNALESMHAEGGRVVLSTGQMKCTASYLAQSAIPPKSADQAPQPGIYSYVEVRDTGEGMDEDTRAKIFEPFFTTKFTGRGLGMAAVAGIVRGHNGVLLVDTEVGRGTTFRVLLPLAEGGMTMSKSPRKIRPKRAPSGRGTVLVVDDEQAVRQLTGAMLSHLDFAVLSAADGLEGLKVFETHSEEITCVLLDLTMPNMDGEACFEALRQLKPDTPVVLVTGYSEHKVHSLFAGKGLAAFLHKPFKMAGLIRTLAAIGVLEASTTESRPQVRIKAQHLH